jgi:GTP pyrophosphokinase
VETADDTCSDRVESALAAALRDLGASGAGTAALEGALEAARITGSLTDDADLAAGVLLYEAGAALPASADRPARSPRSAPQLVATELARLGDFGRQVAWDPGRRLDDAQAETLRKMLLAVVSDPRLVVARLAIQLARLRSAKRESAARRQALAAETRAVYAPLANRLGIWRLKWELEDLALRYLEPEEYRRIAAALAEKRSDRERYIREMCDTLRHELAAAGIDAEVQGRAKHIYSIHRKMQRKHLAFDQLFDVRAVRIVCTTVPDCYAALGIVHGTWPYVPGEFDDYIATPKENRYRSIHTAVIGPRQRAVEIQIRTREMHQHAELGVAAHWRYKEGRRPEAEYARRIDGLRRLLDPAGGRPAAAADASDPDFIAQASQALFEDRVYALTPKGQVVDLPRGATPLDFAYQVHTGLGHRCRGAKIDGRIVPLTRALRNGAVVEIIAGREEAPSRDWLSTDQGYLASPRSRAKVRAWFRRIGAGDNESAGRAIVERELARLSAGTEQLAALVGDLKAADAAQLYRWLGEGEVSVTQFSQAVGRRLESEARASQPAVPPRRRHAPGGRAHRGGPVEIEGVGELPLTLARCCSPVRPEPIVGYVTLGRGVTVHAASCGSLRRMQAARPERVLAARWRDAADASLPVELAVTSYDRRGLVRDLSEAIAEEDLSIESLQTTTDRRDGTARTTIRVAVRDLDQLSRLLRRLARVQNVLTARRTA